MKRFDTIPVLLTVVLLASCQTSCNSTSANEGKALRANEGKASSANEGKPSGGILSVLRPDRITLPEGATLPLVLETAMSSATSRSGDLIVARLAEDVRVGEKVVVPSGSKVRGQVTSAVPSGRVKTRAHLAFDFNTLELEGKDHPLGTTSIDITADDTHKKDAATVGIGTGAGAIVGAVAGGKKGAGIGALIGGAAGTGVVLTDTGKEVRLGTGSRVTVRLTREARL